MKASLPCKGRGAQTLNRLDQSGPSLDSAAGLSSMHSCASRLCTMACRARTSQTAVTVVGSATASASSHRLSPMHLRALLPSSHLPAVDTP